MTESCLKATATPNRGEVAYGYWETLLEAIRSVSDLETEKLAENILSQHSEMVSVEDYLTVFERGLASDPEFGFKVGQSVSLKTFPVLGMTLLSCSNLSQALSQILRYESLNHDLGRSELARHNSLHAYRWTPNPKYLSASDGFIGFHLALSVFVGIKTFAPLLLQKALPIKCVHFVSKESDVNKEYSITKTVENFFECPVFFGKPENSIEVNEEVLEWELAFADPTMFAALTKHAETLLSDESRSDSSADICTDSRSDINSKNDFVHRIQTLLPDSLRRQNFRIEELASELNLSTRSIQRKLKDQGYTYQKLLDETRLKLAQLYLKENKLTMSEIAFMVGYQEQSSFNHAFKNWTGQSPSEFRAKVIEPQVK